MKNLKVILLLLFILMILGFNPIIVRAAAPKNKGISVTTVVKGKKSVMVYFKNLQNAKSVSYVLSYNSKLGPQGAMGTVSTKGKYSFSRQLLFGTCSNKICRYDTGIKNCVLEVTAKLKNGKTDFKRIKLKV